MATSSVSGLASGLDTRSIVDQLILLEAAPQTRLKTTLGTEQLARTSLQTLNAQVANLATQAKELAAPGGWRTLGVTSSSAAVAVSGTTGGAATSFSFTVDQVAAAHRLSFAGTAAPGQGVTSGGTSVQLTVAGTTTTLDTGDGTLNGLVRALNGPGTGVQATTVRLDDGNHRLLVTAASTGAAGAFTLTNADGSDLLGGAQVSAGRDAVVTIGADTISSATNTFADVVQGVSFTLSAAAVGTTVEVTSKVDPDSVRTRVAALVDSVNSALTRIDSLVAAPATSTAGPLAGDSTLRALRNQLLTSIYPEGGGSLAGMGIQTNRSGRLVFDAAAFDKAYAEDPATVQAAFTQGAQDGFAERVRRVADLASDPVSGSLSSAVVGRDQSIDRLEGRIEDWDTRLELKRAAMTRQYTALETALNQLNSQSSWLASQLGSLQNPT